MCEVCGREYKTKRLGRPRRFCSLECGELHRVLERLIRAVPKVIAHATDEAKIDLRYTLFCLVADEIPRVRTRAGTFRGRL